MSITSQIEYDKSERRFADLLLKVKETLLAQPQADELDNAIRVEKTNKVCDAWSAAYLDRIPEHKTWSLLCRSEPAAAPASAPEPAPEEPPVTEGAFAEDGAGGETLDEDEINSMIILQTRVDGLLLLPSSDSTVVRNKTTYRLDGGAGLLYTRDGTIGVKSAKGLFTRA
jgi:hypothetical protein